MTPPADGFVTYQVRDGRGWLPVARMLASKAGKVRQHQERRGRVEGRHWRFRRA